MDRSLNKDREIRASHSIRLGALSEDRAKEKYSVEWNGPAASAATKEAARTRLLFLDRVPRTSSSSRHSERERRRWLLETMHCCTVPFRMKRGWVPSEVTLRSDPRKVPRAPAIPDQRKQSGGRVADEQNQKLCELLICCIVKEEKRRAPISEAGGVAVLPELLSLTATAATRNATARCERREATSGVGLPVRLSIGFTR
ncbi:hypothetical protein MTO96_006446 [Rhipicephalus appendiculatus]